MQNPGMQLPCKAQSASEQITVVIKDREGEGEGESEGYRWKVREGGGRKGAMLGLPGRGGGAEIKEEGG